MSPLWCAPPTTPVAHAPATECVRTDAVSTTNLRVCIVSTELGAGRRGARVGAASGTQCGPAGVGSGDWAGAELPFRQAAEWLERLTGIGLGVETVRTHTQQVGSALVERQQRAAATVLQTQEPAEAVYVAPTYWSSRQTGYWGTVATAGTR